jgi:excisionase family DNA binding protein
MEDETKKSKNGGQMILFPISLDDLENLIRRCVKAEMASRSQPSLAAEGDILDSKELCREFNISLPTLIKYRTAGQIPFFRIGSRLRFRRSEVLEALRRLGW